MNPSGRRWYRDVETYLDDESARRFRKGDDYASVQDRSNDAEPPYEMLTFRFGLLFVQRIPFAGLQRIIEHNYASGPLVRMFVPPTGESRLDPASVKSSLNKVRDGRNDVAHHREITPENFAVTCRRARQWIGGFGLSGIGRNRSPSRAR